jgi:hypothetical protein
MPPHEHTTVEHDVIEEAPVERERVTRVYH